MPIEERRQGLRIAVFDEVGRRGDEHASAGRQGIGDKTGILDGTDTSDRVVSGRGDIYEPVAKLERQGDPWICFRNAISAGAGCRQQPKLTGADSLSGSIGSPRRSTSSSRPSWARWRMRRPRDRKALPSSASDILRVVRWTRRVLLYSVSRRMG